MNRTFWRRLAAAGVLIGATAAAAPGATYLLSLNPYDCRYGNWGGAGYSDGAEGGSAYGSAQPVDRMDEAFRQHDRDIVDADRRWELQYRAAQSGIQKALILMMWTADYREANRRCIAALAALPPLMVGRDGADTWGGRRVPASVGWRLAFRTTTMAFIGAHAPRP